MKYLSNSFLTQQLSLLFPEGMNTRNGTDVDAANAMQVFSSLGYKVKVHNDQTVEQMRELLICGESEAESVPFITELTFCLLHSHATCFWGFFFSRKGRSQLLRLFCLRSA